MKQGTSLLNKNRPPVFCPGCTHERITTALDRAFQKMGLRGDQIAIVSDIGCSGLFDTFFDTHAMHGLHGRALTYAAGLKLARPALNVIVTMGDGGLGIGGAHFLAACRRNLNLTLLILNNFNFGMTGGQFSATTPRQAKVGSGFLNKLENPLDVCKVARSAGAAYVSRCSGYKKDLPEEIEKAVFFEGFSVVDIWGICPGRYVRQNRITPNSIEDSLAELTPTEGRVSENDRKEFGRQYREQAGELNPVAPPENIEAQFYPPETGRHEVIILGNAGQRIITAGEILCLAGMTAGLNVTQKNEYPITVLRGFSISELILSPKKIGFTGIDTPSIIIALGQEGVDRRHELCNSLDNDTLVIKVKGIDVPSKNAKIYEVDLKGQGIKIQDWALASLSVLSKLRRVLSYKMLESALASRFNGKILTTALDLIDRVEI